MRTRLLLGALYAGAVLSQLHGPARTVGLVLLFAAFSVLLASALRST
jgi:hypothetical protein